MGAVYGRQLAAPGAGPIAEFARLFNTPSNSETHCRADIPRLGMRTARFSNAFGAWRREALVKAGGFAEGLIFGEDQYAAAKLILSGWKVVYEAQATVFHSHDYSPMEDFLRYFDVGVFHEGTPWMLEAFGGATGEGKRFVRAEIAFLWSRAPWLIPSAVLRTFLKLAAYRLGRAWRRLPRPVCRWASMNRRFWDRGLEP